MKRYLLDTGMASDLIYRRKDVYRRSQLARRNGIHIGIAMPTVGELLAGAEYSVTRNRNLPLIQKAVRRLFIWPFDLSAAEEYGRLYAELRRSGRIIGQIDVQIAAIALNLGNCTLVTADSDFAAIPGLTIENWS
ncbi:MAG TPA: type II toxin-antitoxin system VapC family toxin [Pirellulaceae bacterium]|nr:type II toxin-antitoxin system VapC family toxin [Pirellulaceae bacterium]